MYVTAGSSIEDAIIKKNVIGSFYHPILHCHEYIMLGQNTYREKFLSNEHEPGRIVGDAA